MMDALELLKTTRRMCKAHNDSGSCAGCAFYYVCNDSEPLCKYSDAEIQKIIDAVEEWGRTNPLVTNEMKVREVFGDNAVNSILALHPSDIKRWLAEPYKERES